MNRKARRTLPLVAVIGKPNVGKSTLINRLVARRASIVSPVEGLTRDVLEREVSWRGRTFRVADTGGLLERAAKQPDKIGASVARRAIAAASEADVVLLVVDSRSGLTGDDFDLSKRLQRTPAPVVLVANKVDDPSQEPAAAEAWSLGLGEPLPVSALHGTGSGELLDRVVDLLPAAEAVAEERAEASIAIVGRPNVGKSLMFNRLAGEDRAIVHHEAGTTRDSIDTIVEMEGRKYRFVDTAGLRRRAKTRGVEIYGAGRTRDAIARSDIALLILDASEGATAQDQRIAQAIADAGVGAVIVANKWDLIKGDEPAAEVHQSIVERLHFVSYAPLIRTSALTGRGVGSVARHISKVLAARSRRVPTARLNSLMQLAQQKTPPPRGLHVLYATQAETSPPTFVLFASGRLPAEWLRFFEHRLREEFEFTGNPIRLVVRERSRRKRTTS